MKRKNSKAKSQAQMAVRCSALVRRRVHSISKSPANTDKSAVMAGQVTALQTQTLCALCVLCGKKKNNHRERKDRKEPTTVNALSIIPNARHAAERPGSPIPRQ